MMTCNNHTKSQNSWKISLLHILMYTVFHIIQYNIYSKSCLSFTHTVSYWLTFSRYKYKLHPFKAASWRVAFIGQLYQPHIIYTYANKVSLHYPSNISLLLSMFICRNCLCYRSYIITLHKNSGMCFKWYTLFH